MKWIVLLVYYTASSIAQNHSTSTVPSTTSKNITTTSPVPSTTSKNITTISITTLPPTTITTINDTTIVTPSSTPNSSDDDDDEPLPIHVRITPNTTVFRGDGTLKCSIHGSNVRRIMPYDLCWEFKEDQNNTGCKTNMRSITFNNDLIPKFSGSIIYCAIIFKRQPNHIFWMVKSQYVAIRKPLKKGKEGAADLLSYNKSYLQKPTMIIITVIVIIVIVVATTTGLLCRRRRKSKIKPPAAIEELSSTVHDNIYSYVPLETVSFYKAKELVTSNQKNNMKSIKPPPLPQRPQTIIEDDDDYIYSYAYGIKVNT